MCDVMEKYENMAVNKERQERIKVMIKEGCSKDLIIRIGYTEEEYEEAEKGLFQLV